MPNATPPILPLPSAVAAQIKSSTTITSLGTVVLGLLANSLDAGSRRVYINVDSRRGAASVEDDGDGIPPKEFGECGGLGKPYHTSKNNGSSIIHGRNGTFLSSVAALSILSITSHHANYLPHATLILHHSRPAARLIPAPSHQHLASREHGTKVGIQDLFGNMPVRVKQRNIGGELSREDEKQFEALRRQIIGMLLAWHNPVSVTLKSAESSKKLNIRGKEMSKISARSGDAPSRTIDVTSICSLLSQAGFIDYSDWDSWVKTSARTHWVTIKGAISLQAAPSKQVQFISVGIRPVLPELGNNILYDDINRLFALSSFGNQDDTCDTEDDNKAGNSNDGRFKKDGFTRKPLKGSGKGVDRWPMFYIRIDLQDTKLGLIGDADRLREGTMSSLLEVIGAMITTFLEENHFSPRARTGRRKQEKSTQPMGIGKSSVIRSSGADFQGSEAANGTYAGHNFSTWSRIKVGKGSKSCGDSPSLSSHGCLATNDSLTVINLSDNSMCGSQNSRASSTVVHNPVIDPIDEPTFEWRHPVSGATILVNARTGLVVSPRPLQRPASASSEHLQSALHSRRTNVVHGSYRNGRLTRSLSNPVITHQEGSWSSELLKKWENPIFDTTEVGIPQASFDGPTIETSDVLHGRRQCCTDSDIQKAFTQASASVSAKISKQSLSTAKILAQVDKKFILIIVTEPSTMPNEVNAELLVLVDQHAADERVRVEGLLADLKASPTSLPKPLTFEVQAREHPILSRLAPSFAALGILYELSGPPIGNAKCRISVTALPAVIAERCRLEPKVLIDLIRREAWKREEEQKDSFSSSATLASSYPQGLLDMLNSRACRSAIMFNDELTEEECSTLVRRLGGCAFPFQCAHGRPSMVPLVNLGVVGASTASTSSSSGSFDVGKGGLGFPKSGVLGRGDEDGEGEKSFGAAWRAWKSDG